MKFTIYKDRRGAWRWRLTAANGKKIANGGECYRRRIDCLRMVKRIQNDVTAATPIMGA
jgi:uncharacterized protein YegP (UPF0339 family)